MPVSDIRSFLKWVAILSCLALAVGSASAFFLWSMRAVTFFRFSHPWLLYLLPLAGFGTGLLYHFYGGTANKGSNLLIDEIHEPGAGVPRRMAPLILAGTLITHLFGGSAGREGTAIQMGGGMAAMAVRWLKLDAAAIRILLMAGVAAGFGSVFGTPWAGAVFALEVLVVGRLQYDALLPCLFSAFVADWTTHAWGAHHTSYHLVASELTMNVSLAGKILLAAAAFGLAGRLFVLASHQVEKLFKKGIPWPPLRPAIGGLLVIGLFFLAGTPDYLGIGDVSQRAGAVTIPAMFTSGQIPATAWLWKLVFTVATLASGMKGGEVTPLFFIGAALGNAMAGVLGVPVDFLAALGFVAIFAAATKTPIASTILGMELFGGVPVLPLFIACVVACRISGSKGIYSSQRAFASPFPPVPRDK